MEHARLPRATRNVWGFRPAMRKNEVSALRIAIWMWAKCRRYDLPFVWAREAGMKALDVSSAGYGIRHKLLIRRRLEQASCGTRCQETQNMYKQDACTDTLANTYACTYTFIYVYVHTYIHTCMHTYIHTYIHAHTHAHVCACVCIYVYLHICIYIRLHYITLL